MSKRNPWTAFYWDDWDADTAHLTLAEQGAYFALLKHYYRTAKPLPAIAEHLRRICRASGEQETSAVDAVVAQFFDLEDCLDSETGEFVKQYRNKRADIELAKCSELSTKRSMAARSKSKAIAQQLPTQPQPQSQPQSQKRGSSPSQFSQTDFDERDLRILAVAKRTVSERAKAAVGCQSFTEQEFMSAVCEEAGLTPRRVQELEKMLKWTGATA